MAEVKHLRTVIAEGRYSYSVICSCGWSAGEKYSTEMAAEMAFSMLHAFVTEED